MRLPPFVCQSCDLGHGRLDQREVRVFSIEPTQVELPHARTLVVAKNSSSTGKSAAKSSEETISYYLRSRLPGRAESFAMLIRGHWAGSEIRNHWVREALWAEDKTRSRNWTLNANLAILRACLTSSSTAGTAQASPAPSSTASLSNERGLQASGPWSAGGEAPPGPGGKCWRLGRCRCNGICANTAAGLPAVRLPK